MEFQTAKIQIDNSGRRDNPWFDEALNAAEALAASLNLSSRDRSRLRLLTEETLGMARAMVGPFSALFWIEADKPGACKLHLEAKADVDFQRRQELLDLSTKGKNIAPRGIMEKVRELFEAGLHGMDRALALQEEYGGAALNYGLLGAMDAELAGSMYLWSLRKYKDSVGQRAQEEPAAWDELEKSIVANIADEVQVGVTRDSVELVIIKSFGQART